MGEAERVQFRNAAGAVALVPAGQVRHGAGEVEIVRFLLDPDGHAGPGVASGVADFDNGVGLAVLFDLALRAGHGAAPRGPTQIQPSASRTGYKGSGARRAAR